MRHYINYYGWALVYLAMTPAIDFAKKAFRYLEYAIVILTVLSAIILTAIQNY